MARYKLGWSANHQKVYRMYVDGLSPMNIMEKTGLDEKTVRNIIRCDRFQSLVAAVEKSTVERARKVFEGKLADAANKIVRLMQSGTSKEKLQFEAAKEILYQCGMKPVEVVETRGRVYTPEEIQSSLTVIKEVQAIEEALSTSGSGFLLKREEDTTSLSAPVQATNEALPVEVEQGVE